MATYTEVYYKDAPFYHPVGGPQFAGVTTSRTLANGDIILLNKVERDAKLMDVVLGSSRQDTNGTPTLAGVFELTDGTTPIVLATLAITFFGSATAATRIARLDNPLAIGYVVPSRGFYLQFRITAGPATGAAGICYFAARFTNVLYGNESPLRPTG